MFVEMFHEHNPDHTKHHLYLNHELTFQRATFTMAFFSCFSLMFLHFASVGSSFVFIFLFTSLFFVFSRAQNLFFFGLNFLTISLNIFSIINFMSRFGRVRL